MMAAASTANRAPAAMPAIAPVPRPPSSSSSGGGAAGAVTDPPAELLGAPGVTLAGGGRVVAVGAAHVPCRHSDP